MSCSDPRKVIHSTMHKTTELEHADEAATFMRYVDVDRSLIDGHYKLWRDVADQMHAAMYGSGLEPRPAIESREPRL